MKNIGCVHVYTGNGKGKTTSALGLAIRGAGRGKKVAVIQFLKNGEEYGEFISLKKLGVEIEQFGDGNFIYDNTPNEKQVELTISGISRVLKIMESEDKYDILILDEFNSLFSFGMISCEVAMKIIKSKPEHMELILTGRDAPDCVVEIADLVTEMKEIKHYFHKGVKARIGIEY